MEKGMNAYILEKFGIKSQDIRSYSPLVLAYIGDGIYDLIIRTVMVGRGNSHVNNLHQRTSQLVKAHTQSELAGVLMPVLTEEEITVYKRGRNAKSATMAKNATVADYRRATGFEALIGYSIVFPERNASSTAFLPSMVSSSYRITCSSLFLIIFPT